MEYLIEGKEKFALLVLLMKEKQCAMFWKVQLINHDTSPESFFSLHYIESFHYLLQLCKLQSLKATVL